MSAVFVDWNETTVVQKPKVKRKMCRANTDTDTGIGVAVISIKPVSL